MANAYVLMTAMPPTKGHKALIDFAQRLVVDEGGDTIVVLCTQPGEPYVDERYTALREIAHGQEDLFIQQQHETIQQVPDGEDDAAFWEMWRSILVDKYYMDPGDFIVASEPYGAKLAEVTGGIFMPFDPKRELCDARATDIRNWPRDNFDKIMPEFQRNMKFTVTLFGAESTGKTTLSRHLSGVINGHWLFEYARPYLETVGTEITTESMTAIWRGQKALQQSAYDLYDKPFIVQDTDLFSTVGYWDFWNMQTPQALIDDAIALKSDLYIITPSNIPFEHDSLRYGGDERESTDQYWIDLCERYGLNYHVLARDEDRHAMRLWEAELLACKQYDEKFKFDYVREGQ